MPHPLEEKYDDKPVIGMKVKITKAGDGLSSSLEVDPIAHHEGEPAYFLLKTNTRQIAYQRPKPTAGGLSRIETHDTWEVVEVNAAEGEELLGRKRAHLNTLREAQAQAEGESLFQPGGLEVVADPEDEEWETPERDGDDTDG